MSYDLKTHVATCKDAQCGLCERLLTHTEECTIPRCTTCELFYPHAFSTSPVVVFSRLEITPTVPGVLTHTHAYRYCCHTISCTLKRCTQPRELRYHEGCSVNYAARKRIQRIMSGEATLIDDLENNPYHTAMLKKHGVTQYVPKDKANGDVTIKVFA